MSPQEEHSMVVPGPTFRLDNSLPCGCRINRDEADKRLRLWYCPTHAAAFEMLEALRANVEAFDAVIKHVPREQLEVASVLDAEVRARTALRRATVGG
jgi:N-formylglutamate amidohydrolase